MNIKEKKSFMLRCGALLLLAALLVPPLLIPRPTKAVFGLGDITITLRKFRLPTDPGQLKDFVFDVAARAAIRAVLRATTNQIVGWIQGPDRSGKNVGFVSNLQGALQAEADAAGGEFLRKVLPGINLCGNLNAYLRLTLSAPPTARGRLECTLTDVVSNFNAFFADFQQGGWYAFTRTTLEPQNNPFGAYIIALDSKIQLERQAKDILKEKYNVGSGFLGVEIEKEVCDDVSVGTIEDVGGQQELEQGATVSRTTGRQKVCRTITQTGTPGQFVANALNEATVGSGIQFGTTAKYFDEAIVSIVNALINKTISSAQGIFAGGIGARTGGVSSSVGFSASSGGVPGTLQPSFRAADIADQTLEQQVVNGIFAANTGVQAIFDQTSKVQEQFFASVDQGDLSNQKEQIRALEALRQQKQKFFDISQEFAQTRSGLLTSTNQNEFLSQVSRIPVLYTQLQRELLALNTLSFPEIASGDVKTDSRRLASDSRALVNEEIALLESSQAHMNRIASSTTSRVVQNQAQALAPLIGRELALLRASASGLRDLDSRMSRALAEEEIQKIAEETLGQVSLLSPSFAQTDRLLGQVYRGVEGATFANQPQTLQPAGSGSNAGEGGEGGGETQGSGSGGGGGTGLDEG